MTNNTITTDKNGDLTVACHIAADDILIVGAQDRDGDVDVQTRNDGMYGPLVWLDEGARRAVAAKLLEGLPNAAPDDSQNAQTEALADRVNAIHEDVRRLLKQAEPKGLMYAAGGNVRYGDAQAPKGPATVDGFNTWGAAPTAGRPEPPYEPKTDVAKVLMAAADLIEPEGAWTQDADARDADGDEVDALASSASCFCASGAIRRVTKSRGVFGPAAGALDALRDYRFRGAYGPSTPEWNDAPERTQQEVVNTLRAAARYADEKAGA